MPFAVLWEHQPVLIQNTVFFRDIAILFRSNQVNSRCSFSFLSAARQLLPRLRQRLPWGVLLCVLLCIWGCQADYQHTPSATTLCSSAPTIHSRYTAPDMRPATSPPATACLLDPSIESDACNSSISGIIDTTPLSHQPVRSSSKRRLPSAEMLSPLINVSQSAAEAEQYTLARLLARELEASLTRIPGVLYTQIQLTPIARKKHILQIPFAASITIKYQIGTLVPHLVADIRQIASHTIPGVSHNRVSIKLVPTGQRSISDGTLYGSSPFADIPPLLLVCATLLYMIASLGIAVLFLARLILPPVSPEQLAQYPKRPASPKRSSQKTGWMLKRIWQPSSKGSTE